MNSNQLISWSGLVGMVFALSACRRKWVVVKVVMYTCMRKAHNLCFMYNQQNREVTPVRWGSMVIMINITIGSLGFGSYISYKRLWNSHLKHGLCNGSFPGRDMSTVFWSWPVWGCVCWLPNAGHRLSWGGEWCSYVQCSPWGHAETLCEGEDPLESIIFKVKILKIQ